MKPKTFFAHIFIVGIITCLFFSGCNNLNPVGPQQPSQPSPSYNTPSQQISDYTVVYNYTDTSQVQLSANNLVLQVGQKLTLQPAPGLTTNTRFLSSGENFFGDIMQQETSQSDTTKAVFTAIKKGKGKLQVIPNTNDTARAVDLWVTVE